MKQPTRQDVPPRAGADAVRRLSDPDLIELLNAASGAGAADLLLTTGSAPKLRIGGKFIDHSRRVLGPEDTRRLLYGFLSDEERAWFDRTSDLDLGIEVENVGRFRLNAYRQRGNVALVLRVIPGNLPTAQDLGLPPAIVEMANLTRGLVLVTGPAGSGKSTLVTALIHKINCDRQAHIVTIEDPIEFVHSNLRSVVDQREVGPDTESFAVALRSVLRQSPDVVMVGEMRDAETVQSVVTLAETGHLVLSTLHTQTATQSISRIIDVLPPESRTQVRAQLSASLRGIVSLALLPTPDGSRCLAAREIVVVTRGIAAMIREQNDHMIQSSIQGGGELGMVTMEASINQLIAHRLVDSEVATAVVSSLRTVANVRGPSGQPVVPVPSSYGSHGANRIRPASDEPSPRSGPGHLLLVVALLVLAAALVVELRVDPLPAWYRTAYGYVAACALLLVHGLRRRS